MNSKSKTALVLVGTLTIGIVLGILGNTTFNKTRRHNIRLSEDTFIQRIEKITNVSEEQKELTAPILDKHAKIIIEMDYRHYYEFSNAMDSLLVDLSKVLPSDQLEKFKERRRNRIAANERNRIGR